MRAVTYNVSMWVCVAVHSKQVVLRKNGILQHGLPSDLPYTAMPFCIWCGVVEMETLGYCGVWCVEVARVYNWRHVVLRFCILEEVMTTSVL